MEFFFFFDNNSIFVFLIVLEVDIIVQEIIIWGYMLVMERYDI